MLAPRILLLHPPQREWNPFNTTEADMLVLSRKAGEQLLIGDSIVVTVVRVNAHEVRLGIEAPSDIEIVRSELVDGVPRAGVRPRGARGDERRRTVVAS